MAGVSAAMVSGASQMRLRVNAQLAMLRLETERSLSGLASVARAQVPAMESAGESLILALTAGMQAAMPSALAAVEQLTSVLANAAQAMQTAGSLPSAGQGGLSGGTQVSVKVSGGLSAAQVEKGVKRAVGNLLMTR